MANLYEWCGWPTREADQMHCPYCQQIIAENWLSMWVVVDENGHQYPEPASGASYVVHDEDAVVAICADAGVHVPRAKGLGASVGLTVVARWMRCPNAACRQLLVHVARRLYDPYLPTGFGNASAKNLFTEEVIVFPRRRNPRPIDPLVPDPYATDYREASLILNDCPRMSAVLSRKVLADLLESAGYKATDLEKQIDAFLADPNHPQTAKENLHHLRVIGNFAAHQKKDKSTGEVIAITPEEAEWTLAILDELFEYFIVAPAKNAARRAAFDKKLSQGGYTPPKQVP